VPSRDALFVDAGTARGPRQGGTRKGGTGHVAAVNMHEAGEPVDGFLRVADVPGLSGDRFAVREHFSRRLAIVGRDEPVPVHLDADQAALYVAAPIARGAAVFGLLEKFVSPATVLSSQDDGAVLRVRVADGGTLGVWLEKPARTVRVDGQQAPPRVVDGVLEVALPEGREHEVEIAR
jgi:hypothetical protein